MLTLLAVVCGALAAALLVFHTHFRLRALPMAAALLLTGAALLLCRAGMNRGLLVFRPSCTAEEAAGAFFRAVSEGDSDAALALVADGTLPLGQSEPEDEAASALWHAAQDSFDWSIAGEAQEDGLYARVPVQLKTLEPESMREALRENVMGRLETLVDQRAYSEVYDENGMYRSAVTDEAYLAAVQELLEQREAFETALTLELTLRYDAPDWHILPDAALSSALGGDFAGEAHNTKSAVLDGLTYIRKIYRIGENDPVAPAPDPSRFGTTTDPAVISALIEDSAVLLQGQDTVWNEDIELMPNSEISYYCDETILVIVWKENVSGKGCTFAEVRIADPSQLRRRLSGDSYDAHVREYGSKLAADANAVISTNGDFYAYRQIGITVYQRQLFRFEPEGLDTCFFTADGRMLLVPRGTLTSREEAESFIRDNDVLFSAAFGPILIKDGELQDLGTGKYKIGQGDEPYSRSAIGMTDELHYLLMTINYGAGVTVSKIPEAAQILYDKGCRDAYALDGGQTGELWMNGRILNNVDWNAERQVSDIFYFASALPTKGGEDA